MIKVFDTGEEFADRYTVIINHSLYTMSKHPSSPQGVNMYCCEISNEYEPIGKEIGTKDLSREVRWAILDRLYGEVGK